MIVPPKSPMPCHYLASQYAKRVISLIDVDICCTSINRNMLRRVTGRSLDEDKDLNTATVLSYLDFEDDTPVLTARVRQNMVTLCSLFDVKCEFAPALGFLSLMNINQGLNHLIDFLGGHLEEHALERLLSELSGLSSDEVANCLIRLQQNGVLLIDRWLNEPQDITMPSSMLYVLTTEVVVSKEQLLKHALCASPPPH